MGRGDAQEMEGVVDHILQRSNHVLPHADKEGWTPLHCAAIVGNAPIIRRLLDEGAVPDCLRYPFLSQSAIASRSIFLRVMMGRGMAQQIAADAATPGRPAGSCQRRASAAGWRGVATGQGRLRLCAHPFCCQVRPSPLYNAPRVLVSVGPTHTSCGPFPSRAGHDSVIHTLLEYEPDGLNARAMNGTTPLHLACGGGFVRAVELLCTVGANVDAKDVQGKPPSLASRHVDERSDHCWIESIRSLTHLVC